MNNSTYYAPQLNTLAMEIGKWRERKGFETSADNVPEKLALIHSEVSEALEADRSGNAENFAEELADTIIRILDLSNALGIDITGAVRWKMEKNEGRPHKHGRGY